LTRQLRNPLIVIPLCAFAVRILVIVWLRTYHIPEVIPGPPMSVADPHLSFGNEIGSIAKALVTGHGFSMPFGVYGGPTAWIPPVYPLITAGVFKIFGVFSDAAGFVLLSFSSLCAALTCVPIIKIGERLTPSVSGLAKTSAWDGRGCGIVSAWIWALAPYFVRSAVTLIWDTSLMALLMSVAVLLTLRLADSKSMRSWACYGAFWALVALTNPVMLSFLGVALLWLAWQRLRLGSTSAPVPHPFSSGKAGDSSAINAVLNAGKSRYPLSRDLKLLAVMLLVFALGCSPWVVRNRVAFGHWVFIRSNFGFEFYFGNGHNRIPFGWMGGHPSVNPFERADYVRLGELGYVNSRKAKALQFIHDYPREFAEKQRAHIWAFWAGVPVSSYFNDNRWQPWFFAPLSLLSLLGTLFLITRRIYGAGLFAGIMLLYPVPFYIAFPQERHRHPMEPFMLIAAVFLAGVLYSEVAGLILEKLFDKPELAEAGTP
jgi:hypothetical protein